MYISTPAPHRPATPAPQYADKFANEVAPRTPSYGLVGTDKHWIISKGELSSTTSIISLTKTTWILWCCSYM